MKNSSRFTQVPCAEKEKKCRRAEHFFILFHDKKNMLKTIEFGSGQKNDKICISNKNVNFLFLANYTH